MIKTFGSSMSRHRAILAVALGAGLLVGCASPRHRAPVEDRGALRPAVPGAAPSAPGSENAGKPGYYTVKPGDTLIRIAAESGQHWRDIQRWNNMADANALEVGQVLRVQPPVGPSASGGGASPAPSAPTSAPDTGTVSTKPVVGAKVESKPLDAKPEGKTDAKADGKSASAAASAASTPAASAPAPAASPPPAPAAVPDSSAASEADADRQARTSGLKWSWPARGTVLEHFNGKLNKGIVIAGKLGDPVSAVADGRVIYAGSAMRSYGNLIIVQHVGEVLSVYAHNDKLLVKENDTVRRGQRIAQMGSTDAPRVQLLFEMRDKKRQGTPINPESILPPYGEAPPPEPDKPAPAPASAKASAR